MSVDEVLDEVVRICERSSAERVYLYGSRAKGTGLERSDIDIAVAGAEDFEKMAEEIEDIETLYTVDLLDLDTCKEQRLLEDIASYGRKIYEKI